VAILSGIILVMTQRQSGSGRSLIPSATDPDMEEGFAVLAASLTEENAQLRRNIGHAERERDRLEHYLDTLMANVPANIYFKDLSSRFIRVNNSQASWLGQRAPSDFIGKTDHDFFGKEHADHALQDEKKIIETGKPIVGYVEKELLPTGEEEWVLTTKMPFRDRKGRIIGTFGISNKVTELVHARQALERERNTLRSLIDSLPDHVYIKEASGTFGVVNKAFAKFVGQDDPEKLQGKAEGEIFPVSLTNELAEEDQEVFRSRKVLTREVKRIDSYGGERILVTSKVPVMDANGDPYAIVGTNRDVTEQRKAREALLQTERQIQDIVDNCPAVIFLKNLDGSYVLVNRQFERLFHVKRQEIIGKDDYSVFDVEAADTFRENDILVIEEGEPIQVEEEVPHDDGVHIYVSLRFPLRDLNGRVYAVGGVSTDITERKHHEEALSKLNDDLLKANSDLRSAQEQLIQAEKMESVGRLAAGVAHEVKNPLAMIGMGLEIVARRAQDDEKLFSAVERMRRGVNRAKEIIKGMVDFSSAHQLKMEECSMNDVVKEALALARYELRKGGVEVAEELAEDLPTVALDATKVEQVLLNLLINGMHAMEGGGTITVRTRTGIIAGVERNEGVRTGVQMNNGQRFVAVDVLDCGEGLGETKLASIFDPFYTTKPTGVGTGLGLSVARKIVELHQGMLEIANREEGGVRATMTFKASMDLAPAPVSTE
jgi:PAS domain S-box-containing protein